jgi:uncharacterized protein YaiL (DUF2058 family)
MASNIVAVETKNFKTMEKLTHFKKAQVKLNYLVDYKAEIQQLINEARLSINCKKSFEGGLTLGNMLAKVNMDIETAQNLCELELHISNVQKKY